jgi:cytochrome c oxidase cbb3-type subunit 3
MITGGPPTTVAGALVRTSDLHAGGRVESAPARNPYEGDGNALAEGARLYTWFNCTGCHGGKGGGGIGPPLADTDWIYGGEPENIFQTIVQGRPNGMPAFGSQIPSEQVWKIVAFVRTLSEPARADREGSTQRAGASR